ncbi:MAG: PIG-L family deacetylase [Planctomycetes bacterium]|nr:PIG-L family deacetylase [Planctomycetota bacterium]
MIVPVDSPHVLAIGAHPDDIEIGAGGLVHRLIQEHNAVVHFLILTEGIQHPKEGEFYDRSKRRKESVLSAQLLGVPARNVEVLEFPDCGLHELGHQLIRTIESRVHDDKRPRPFDMILTHSGEDTHADHREAHEASISALRNYLGTVLLYQSPSTKPNSFHPTLFVNLPEEAIRQKDRALQAHASQQNKEFMKIARTVGLATGWALFHHLTGKYCEAFEIYKWFWL